jgi:hypothetical protein
MARYYEGDINGAPWLWQQPTDCMTAYGADYIGRQIRFNCGCCTDELFDGEYEVPISAFPNGMFCDLCYKTLDEAKASLEDPEDEVAWFKNERHFQITQQSFQETGKPFIQENKELFDKYVKRMEFDIGYLRESKVEYATVVSNTDFNVNEDRIVADLIILKEIEHFFDETKMEVCAWTVCE